MLLQLLRLDGLDADLNKRKGLTPISEYFFQFQMENKKYAHLCGLSLLLKLLKLLSCDEADWFVPCDQLCSSRH